MAEVLEIVRPRDELLGHFASLEHFIWREGGEIQSDIVIQQDNVTPYCLDHESRRLIFTDLPPRTDLTSVAFVHADQKRLARRLIAVPYEELPSLADRVPIANQITFIFNSSRSGTTLMSQILNQVDGAVSFSELDFFTNVCSLAQLGEERSELIDLLSRCVRLFAYPYADRTIGFKFRHTCVESADLFHAAIPAAKHLFMYRNAIDWSASWRRFDVEWGTLADADVNEVRNEWHHVTERTRTTYMDRLVAPDDTTIPSIVGRLLEWIDSVEGYLRAYEQGVPFFAFRYEDLNAHRQAMLAKVLDYVGIGRERVQQAMRGFEHDSQAGTGLQRKDGRANPLVLSNEQVQTITDALEKHARQLTPELILPGTVRP